MPPIRVLILGHSFIRHVHDFFRRNFNTHIAKKLSLDDDLLIRWDGMGLEVERFLKQRSMIYV